MGAPHGVVDQSCRDHPELDVAVLTHLDEPVERHLGADARPAANDADRLIDHGTVTASLAHGVPIAGLPYPAADQPFLAARIQALGAGLAMDGDSIPAIIRSAVRDLLDQPSFREAAARLAKAIRLAPGAAGAADVLEDLANNPKH